MRDEGKANPAPAQILQTDSSAVWEPESGQTAAPTMNADKVEKLRSRGRLRRRKQVVRMQQ